MKITLIKERGKAKHYTRMDIDKLAAMISDGTFSSEVGAYRELIPLLHVDSGEVTVAHKIPQMCFLSELKKDGGVVTCAAVNRLTVLQINNLRSIELAQEVRDGASQLPYTRMSFVGATGRSVVIVCATRARSGQEVTDEDEYAKKAYAQLALVYQHYLHIAVDRIMPSLDQTVMMSADPQVYYDEESELFHVDLRDRKRLVTTDEQRHDAFLSHKHIYYYCYQKMVREIGDWTDEEATEKALNLLAKYCHESGVPMALAVRLTMYHSDIAKDEQLVALVFQSFYEKDKVKPQPHKHIPNSLLVALRTEQFMNEHYEIRKNVLTGVAQYRRKDVFNFTFHDITEDVRNTMTIRALKAGLDSWDKDLNRYIHSQYIPAYNPLEDYIENLPCWDGKDRIKTLADRVADTNETFMWSTYFHLWMRSMVAHWMGKDYYHGNAIVPLLIGSQGCGKSSFCSIILPPALKAYYNDKINFKNDNDINLALSSFALINIDEFDSLSRSQQPLLKYLISKSDVKMRPPYGKAFENRCRYASFIGTTNSANPLVDPTGSRRFVCVRVKDSIDFTTPIDYEQVYAQLKEEIETGARYWLDDEDNQALIAHNSQFMRLNDLSQMIDNMFSRPVSAEQAQILSVSEIITLLQMRFPYLSLTKNTNAEVGRLLQSLGYERKRISSGSAYLVVQR